jgi:hypothetical protein
MSEETMTPETGSGELTVNEAAAHFEGFLSAGEESTEQPETVETEQEDSADYEEAAEATEDEVVDADDVEVEDGEEETEYEEEELQEEPQRFTVKAAGEEKEVTLDELMQGYQLGADYTKKTQEVAEQRKAVEAEQQAIQEAKQVRDTYAQRLQAIEQFLTGNQDSPEDLAAMKENDPIGYAVKVAELTEKKEQLAQVRAEQERLAQQQQAEQQQEMAKFVQQEATKLSQVLPEFSDPTKGEQIRNEIRNYGKSVGFSDQELANVYDSRHVLMLHKAMMYDKLQKSKPQVTKKVAQAPKMVKSGTKVKEGNADIRKKQMQRLKQTGKARDAAALFENFIS